MTEPEPEPYDVDASREVMASAIARGQYANVTLVEKPSPDANAQHGTNAPEEMDGA